MNCDEQYLPGALAAVRDYFEAHPQVEVLLAGSLITDGAGQYICHRELLPPNPRHIWYRFPFLTSSVFIRRRVIMDRRILFDTHWCDMGDFHWAVELLKRKVPMAACRRVTSVFTDTGENMNLKPNGLREKAETDGMIPLWLRPFKWLWILNHNLRRWRAGHYRLEPMSYEIYTQKKPEVRTRFEVAKPTAIWSNRLDSVQTKWVQNLRFLKMAFQKKDSNVAGGK